MKKFIVLLASSLLCALACPALAADATWNLNTSGTWSSTANWSGGTVADGAGSLADFSKVDITANRTIALDSNRTIGRLIFGDAVWTSSGYDWTLQSGALTIDNTGGTGGPSITIANRSAVISTVLSGSNGLSLALPWSNYDATLGMSDPSSGMLIAQTSGGLTLSGSNSLSGALNVSGGTVQVNGAAGNFGAATALVVTGNGVIINGDLMAATNNNSVTNRIGNGTATLALGGTTGAGTFTMPAPDTSSTTSQTFASLSVNPGFSVVNSTATSSTGGVTNLRLTGTGGGGYVRNANGLVAMSSGIGTATQTFSTVNGSNIVTMASTAGIQVGQPITGVGLPGLSSGQGPVIVQAILSDSTLQLSANANSTGSATATYYVAANNQTVQFANAPTAAGGSSVSGAGSDAILTGAILNGIDFVKAASGSVGAASYVNTLTAGKNVDVTGNLSTSGSTSINSLRLGDTTQRTVTIGASDTLTIASGGILLPASMPTAGINHTITGGSLTSGQGDLWIYAASGAWVAGGGPRGNADPRNANWAATIASKITGNISVTLGGNPGERGGGIVLFASANDYTGGTYLLGGQVSIGGDAGLGATSGTVTAVSGVNAIQTLGSFAFDANRNFVINSGAVLTIGDRGWENTIAGKVSGGGVLEAGYVSGGQRLILTGTNSNFTGQYHVNGSLRATEGVGLSSNANLLLAGRYGWGVLGTLETSGTFTRGLGSGPGQVQWNNYSGTEAIFGDGGFVAVGGALTVNLGGKATPTALTWGSNGFLPFGSLILGSSASTDDVTFQNPIDLSGTMRSIFASGAGSTKAIMSGVISGDANSGIWKTSGGTLVLSGLNTYQGKTGIGNGTLSVARIANVSGTGNLGAPTTVDNATIGIGGGGSAGALVYTGTGETTDRVIDLAGTTGGATIDQSGSGLLKFSSNSTATGAGAKTLVLQGSTAGTGEIAGGIADNSSINTTSLSKLGTGTWILSGTNSYTGETLISGGTLEAASLTDYGVAGALGARTSSQDASGGLIGLLFQGGTLRYSGSTAQSTNRAIRLSTTGGGGTIDASGSLPSATVSFTASSSPNLWELPGARTLTLTGSNTGNNTFAMAIQGGNGNLSVVKSGPGKWVLTGNNSYSGNTTINAGTLQIGDGTSTLTLPGNYSIGADSTLRVFYNTSGVQGGSWSWSKFTGSGTLSLNTARSADGGWGTAALGAGFTGKLLLEGGRVILTGSTDQGLGNASSIEVRSGGQLLNSKGSVSQPLTLGGFGYGEASYGGVALRLDNTATITGAVALAADTGVGAYNGSGVFDNTISGGYGLTVNADTGFTGTVILQAPNTYTGATTVPRGTLQLGNGTAGKDGSLATNSIVNSGAVVYNLAGAQTASYPISGAGSLTKSGSGALTLTGSNSYTGATTVSAGTLKIGGPSALPAASQLNVNGGVLDLNGNNFTTASMAVGTASGSITDNAALSGTSVFTLFNTSPGPLAVPISDGANGRVLAVNVVNTMANGQSLAANSTFSGGVTILGGAGNGTRLSYGGAAVGAPGAIVSSPLGRGTLTIGQSATDRAQLMVGDGLVLNNILFNSALGTDVASAIRLAGTNNVFAGTLIAGLADINLGEGNVPAAATLRGQLAGSNGLWIKNAYGSNLSVTLSNTTASLNNYLGNTTVDSRHTLILGAANQIPSGAGYGSMVLNGWLNLGGFSAALNNLTGSGWVEAGGGSPVLNVGATNLNGTFAGVLMNASGTLSLAKSGTGTFTLTGSQSYTGATTISDGVLQIGTGGTAGALPVGSAIATNGMLVFNHSNDLVQGTDFSSAAITGTGSLKQAGSGLLTLSGSNTYTGATIVSAGKLIVSGSLAGTTSLSVSSGAELKVNGLVNSSSSMSLAGTLSGSGTVGAVTVQSGGILSPGNSPGTLTTGSLSLAGGGSYLLELINTTGTAGTNWDQVVATTLDLSQLSSSNKFTLSLQTLGSANTPWFMDGFDPAANTTWAGVIKFSGLAGSFDSRFFTIDTTNFWNTYDGSFSVVRNGSQLDLQYLAIPEPSVVASLVSGLGMLVFLQRRRR